MLRFLDVCSALIVESSAETAGDEDEVDEIIGEEIPLVVTLLAVERETQAETAVERDEQQAASEGEATEAVAGAAEPAGEGDTEAKTAVGWVWG